MCHEERKRFSCGHILLWPSITVCNRLEYGAKPETCLNYEVNESVIIVRSEMWILQS